MARTPYAGLGQRVWTERDGASTHDTLAPMDARRARPSQRRVYEEGMMATVYRVAPAEEISEDDFERFMRDEVIAPIHRGPTRVGQITGIRLYRFGPEARERMTDRAGRVESYLWLIEWDGLDQTVEALVGPAIEKLKAAGAAVRPAGEWLLVHGE